MNGPSSEKDSWSQASNSFALPGRVDLSVIDTRRLRHVVIEKLPEGACASLFIPGFKGGHLRRRVGFHRARAILGRMRRAEQGQRQRRETLQNLRARRRSRSASRKRSRTWACAAATAASGVSAPRDARHEGAEEVSGGDRQWCARLRGVAVVSATSLRKASSRRSAARAASSRRAIIASAGVIAASLRGASGKVAEESGSRNPPRTGSRPLPDLKSGRPTRDASPPCAAAASGAAGELSAGASSLLVRNRSSRCGLMRRRSPRRKVTPCRSKNFQDLDRHLAPVFHFIAELGGGEVAMRGGEAGDDADHLAHGGAQKKKWSCATSSTRARRPSSLSGGGFPPPAPRSGRRCRARAAGGSAPRRRAGGRPVPSSPHRAASGALRSQPGAPRRHRARSRAPAPAPEGPP